MWHVGAGGCNHGNVPEHPPFLDPDVPTDEPLIKTRAKILHYITVGYFLEACSGKELSALTNNEFPLKLSFHKWCRARGVKSYKMIDYDRIINHIRSEL